MKKPVLSYTNKTHKNLSDNGEGLVFCKLLPLFEEILEISFVAELSDDVAIVRRTEDIVAFEYVRMI
jgi:hypothetical protein